jgi:hypothetical protein
MIKLKKNQLKNKAKSTWVNQSNIDHEIKITL